MSSHYQMTIDALIEQRNRINQAIDILQELCAGDQSKKETRKREVKDDGTEDVLLYGSKKARGPGLTVSDAIRQAVREAERTSIEVADRVQQLLPDSSRDTISTIISQRLKVGELRKDDYLKLHLVKA